MKLTTIYDLRNEILLKNLKDAYSNYDSERVYITFKLFIKNWQFL